MLLRLSSCIVGVAVFFWNVILFNAQGNAEIQLCRGAFFFALALQFADCCSSIDVYNSKPTASMCPLC